jgi:hypothetical protein
MVGRLRSKFVTTVVLRVVAWTRPMAHGTDLA